jgi:hypothetical protein
MITKIFVNEENKALFNCPECGRTKTVDVSKYMTIDKFVRGKIKCSCEHVSSFELERRKQFRKSTNLQGRFEVLENDQAIDRGKMVVVDISVGGFGLKLNVPRLFQVGDELSVEFRLDDKQRSLIRKKVVIQSIRDKDVGVKFVYLDDNDDSDQAIGFYLFG